MTTGGLRYLSDAERLLAGARYADARRVCEQGLRAAPNEARLWHALAAACLGTGDLAVARQAAERVSILLPRRAAGPLLVAQVAYGRRDLAAAGEALALSLARSPSDAELNQVADLALEIEDWRVAEQALDRLLTSSGGAEAQLKRAVARQGAGRFEDAIADYGDAAARLPESLRYTAELNRSACLFQLNRFRDAAAAAAAAAVLRPGDPVAAFNAGSAWLEAGEIAAAIAAYDRCSLPRAASAALYARQFIDPPDTDALFAAHARWGMRVTAEPPPPPTSVPREHGRIRLGLVSADFRDHPVALFCEGWLRELDRTRFEVYVYFDSPQHDATTTRFAALAAHARVCAGAADDALADRLRADEIDVLIEFGGHVGDRAALLTRRIAPVQMTYLAYPGTTGLKTVDYYLTDASLDPPGAERHYTEALLRVGPTCVSYLPPSLARPVGPLPAQRRGVLTFASFNRPSKLSAPTLARWAAVLLALPTARLMVVGKGFEDAISAAPIADALQVRGVAPERVHFRGSLPFADYLAFHDEVDVVLDCSPWSGRTVTLHAAWMGVPTLTRRVPTHAGRFSAAIMDLLDLPQFVTDSDAAFVDQAVAIAGDLAALAALRAGLRARLEASPLCDHAALAARIGEALGGVWRRAVDAR